MTRMTRADFGRLMGRNRRPDDQSRRAGNTHARYGDAEHRALARHRTHLQPTAHQIGRGTGDRQAESKPQPPFAGRVRHLKELIEDRLELVCRDPDPSVPDLNGNAMLRSPAADQDPAVVQCT